LVFVIMVLELMRGLGRRQWLLPCSEPAENRKTALMRLNPRSLSRNNRP
jgi:hypothetical protein